MSKKDDHYTGAILEDIQDKLQRMAEAMADVPAQVRSINRRLGVVEEDVKVIKLVVTDQSKEIRSHKQELAGLKRTA